jgi:hypothetical protein
MTLLIPGRSVSNWYQDVSFSFELMVSFVDGIEEQAAKSIVNYKEKKRSELVVENHPEGEFQNLVQVYQGFDSESCDLDGIFEEYFPSLQRRSALLTVCSYFEYELDQLCLLYQREKRVRLAPSDLHDAGGIDRSNTYLEKVAGLNLQKASQKWNAIKRVQLIRNVIVHRNGKLRDQDGNVTDKGEKIIGFMKQVRFLRGDDEIILDMGFLSDVLDNYEGYFKLIGESIKTNERDNGGNSRE